MKDAHRVQVEARRGPSDWAGTCAGSAWSPLHESLDTGGGDGGRGRAVCSPSAPSGLGSPQLRGVASPPHDESMQVHELPEQQCCSLRSKHSRDFVQCSELSSCT